METFLLSLKVCYGNFSFCVNAEHLFEHYSSIPELYFPMVIFIYPANLYSYTVLLAMVNFSCKANSRKKITCYYNLLFECFLWKIICSLNKCKVKSVKYNLKYKNKAVRVCYISGIT